VNDELERISKEAVMAYLEYGPGTIAVHTVSPSTFPQPWVLSWHSPGGTKENQEISQSGILALGPTLEPGTCWIQIRSELLSSEGLNSPYQIKVYFNARRRVSCNLSPAE
jgi:hypothetical protein